MSGSTSQPSNFARLWTKKDVESFINYTAVAMKNDKHRIDLLAYNGSVQERCVDGEHEPVIENELLFLMNKIVYGKRYRSEPGDPRIDKMVFRKDVLYDRADESKDETRAVGDKTRQNMQSNTKSHMMKLYSEHNNIIRTAGNAIVKHRLEINKIRQAMEKDVKSSFTKFFESLSKGIDNAVVNEEFLGARLAQQQQKARISQPSVPVCECCSTQRPSASVSSQENSIPTVVQPIQESRVINAKQERRKPDTYDHMLTSSDEEVFTTEEILRFCKQPSPDREVSQVKKTVREASQVKKTRWC